MTPTFLSCLTFRQMTRKLGLDVLVPTVPQKLAHTTNKFDIRRRLPDETGCGSVRPIVITEIAVPDIRTPRLSPALATLAPT